MIVCLRRRALCVDCLPLACSLPRLHAGALIPDTMPLWAAILAVFFLKEQIPRPGVRDLS